MSSMITPAVLTQRHARARDLLPIAGIDALVAYSAPRGLAAATRTSGNVGWLAGFTPMWAPSIFILTSTRAIVVAAGKNEARLHATKAGTAVEVVTAGQPGFAEHVARVLAEESIVRVGSAGFDEMAAPLASAMSAKLSTVVWVDTAVQALRLRRDPEEIILHRRAAQISDLMIGRAFEVAAQQQTTPAMLLAEVEHQGRREGADISRLWLSTGPAPTVTYFEMFELPSKLERGDRVQLGTMVSAEGYFAQGLRIGSLGPAAPALIDAVAIINSIQDESLSLLRPGRPVRDLVDLIENRIAAVCPFTRETDPFRFQSCHGLGLDYNEPGPVEALSPLPRLGADNRDEVVSPGMVFEIHPNFSLPGVGHVCAGDVALVTENGAEWLTQFPRGVYRIE